MLPEEIESIEPTKMCNNCGHNHVNGEYLEDYLGTTSVIWINCKCGSTLVIKPEDIKQKVVK